MAAPCILRLKLICQLFHFFHSETDTFEFRVSAPVSKMTSSVAPPVGRSMTCVHSQDVRPERRHLCGTFAALHTITSSGRCDSNGADGNTIDMLLKFGMDQLPSAKRTHAVIVVWNTTVRRPQAVLNSRGGGIASKHVI